MKNAIISIGSEAINHVDQRFVSFAIDTAQIVGGKWWAPNFRFNIKPATKKVEPINLRDKRLIELSKELAPAYLRIGGSDADFVYYQMTSQEGTSPLYRHILTKERIDEIIEFAEVSGMKIIFNLNAGPSNRDKKNYIDKNALELIQYASHKIDTWELGNEVNGFIAIHGPKHRISGKQYAQDFSQLKNKLHHELKLIGPSCIFIPRVGEVFGITRQFLQNTKTPPDILSWHYYPQQSKRFIGRVRPARYYKSYKQRYLNDVQKWAKRMHALHTKYAPKAQLWMTEIGHAMFGGEPNHSNRYIAGIWWMDLLGTLARMHHQVVVRQTLIGSDYGIIDDKTLEPNPDYYNSLLWKKCMGSKVFKASSDNPYLRVYAHSTTGKQRGTNIALLAINIHDKQSINLKIPQGVIKKYHLCTAPNIRSKKVTIDEQTCNQQTFTLPPLSYGFFLISKN